MDIRKYQFFIVTFRILNVLERNVVFQVNTTGY